MSFLENVGLKCTELAIVKILAKIRNLVYRCDLLLQAILIGFYIYSMVSNHERISFLIANAILLFISIIYFTVKLFTKKKISRAFLHFVTISKLLIRSGTAILSIIELYTVSYSDLKLILTSITIILILAQFALEFIKFFIEDLINTLHTAFVLDLKTFQQSPSYKAIDKAVEIFQNPSAIALELLNKPLEKLAGKNETNASKEQVEFSKNELKLREQLEELAVARTNEKQQKKLRKKEEKEAQKKERVAEAKSELQENLNAIKEKVKSTFRKK